MRKGGMGLREQIDTDIKGAMKSGAKDKLSALRMLSAALKNKQIDKKRPLTDDEVAETVRYLIKQRKDSIEQFAKGGRQDLVDKETAEVSVLEVYLPKQLSREEVEKIFCVDCDFMVQRPIVFGRQPCIRPFTSPFGIS